MSRLHLSVPCFSSSFYSSLAISPLCHSQASAMNLSFLMIQELSIAAIGSTHGS